MSSEIIVHSRGLSKKYWDFRGGTQALEDIDLEVAAGSVVGLVGLNGSGKSTLLNSLLGLQRAQGELRVLGRDPFVHRTWLMRRVCNIGDVAVLPRWMRVSELLDYVQGVHSRFSRAAAERFLARTQIDHGKRVAQLSKGMVVQLHLALVMAIDVRLLVLDEPTLGLDILYRKLFYESLMGDYFDRDRSIIISTHQVEEIETVLTHVIFLHRGKLLLYSDLETLGKRFVEVELHSGADLGELTPMSEFVALGRRRVIFDGVERHRLEPLGQLRIPSLADLFVAMIGGSYAAAADPAADDLHSESSDSHDPPQSGEQQ